METRRICNLVIKERAVFWDVMGIQDSCLASVSSDIHWKKDALYKQVGPLGALPVDIQGIITSVATVQWLKAGILQLIYRLTLFFKVSSISSLRQWAIM